MAVIRRRLRYFVCSVVTGVLVIFLLQGRFLKEMTKPSEPVVSDCPCGYDPVEIKVKDDIVEMETNEDALIAYFRSKQFSVQKGLGKRREVLDPDLEVPLFRYPPLTHLQCLPNETQSEVHVISPRDHYEVGDRIQFRADLYTTCRAPRRMGGDEVRMWLKSADGKSSVPAKVIDLHNGSYIGESVLKWPGVTLVRVSLTYPREFLQAVVELHHTMHAMRWTTATFDNRRGVKEVSPCASFTPIPGFAHTCNLTSCNSGRPWFCAKPQKKGLNCSHWQEVGNLPYLSPLPLSLQMRQFVTNLDHCCSEIRVANLRLIANEIRITAKQANQAPPSLHAPCSSRPIRESWESPTPRGWLRNKKWISETCTLPELTSERVKRCMRNTTLLLLGDSNQRMLWLKIEPLMGCSRKMATVMHAPRLCQNFPLNSVLLFVPHALPFSMGNFTGLKTMPLPKALQHVQKYHVHSNKLIVVIHFYLHLSLHPVQVYRRFVQEARKDIEDFLQSHPKTKFLIRGPHVLYQGNNNHAYIGDNFAHWYKRIWREEFEGLLDRVWYLDIWDLTLAAENVLAHPGASTTNILRILFGYMCDVE